MIMTPPRSTRTYTLFPYTTLFRSEARDVAAVPCVHGDDRCPAVDDVSVAVGIREAQDAAGRLRRRTHDRELARRAGCDRHRLDERRRNADTILVRPTVRAARVQKIGRAHV